MNKALLLIIVSYLLAFRTNGQQQEDLTEDTNSPRAQFGIKAGLNISSFSASINSETKAKTGLNFGFYIRKPIISRSFFRPEIYYSNQGQKDNYVIPPTGPSIGSTTTSMHYVNLPLLFEYGRNISFQIGPQIGFLLKSSEKGTVSSVKVNNDLKEVMSRADFGVVFGLGISINKSLSCGVRYNLGISDIYVGPNSNYPAVSNRAVNFYISTHF